MSKTVLVADDDRQLVEFLATRMTALGLQVRVAHEAKCALELLLDDPPDLICLRKNLPAGEGLSVCEVLARDEQYAVIPVIVLSGPDDAHKQCHCGNRCAYHLQKLGHPQKSGDSQQSGRQLMGDVWSRVEPVIYELIDIEPPKKSHPSTADHSNWSC